MTIQRHSPRIHNATQGHLLIVDMKNRAHHFTILRQGEKKEFPWVDSSRSKNLDNYSIIVIIKSAENENDFKIEDVNSIFKSQEGYLIT